MPDLDLIKQAEQGVREFRQGQSGDLESGSTKTATNAGDAAADLLQEQQTARRRFNEWL
jgi:hypothetical protein